MRYLGKAALVCTQGKTWVKFCLPTLHFLMGRTEGKNESFIAIRMRIHQKLCSSLTPSWTRKKNGGRRLCSNFCLLSAYMVYLLLLQYCVALVGCPDVSKNKTLNSGNTSVVLFSCFVKFKCLGDVLDSVTPITFCHIKAPSFGRSYNLAQILI